MRCSHAVRLALRVHAGLVIHGRGRVIEVEVDVVFAASRRPSRACRASSKGRRFRHVVGLRLAAEAAAEQRHVADDVLLLDAERAATVSCTACGFCVGAQTSTLPSLNSATAAGGSIAACASIGM